MSDKLTEEELHKVIERRSTGKTSFADFLEELSKTGVVQYDIDVATGQASYMGEHSEIKTDPQVNFVIFNHFDRNQALQVISNPTLPFLDFLRELANAGITTYNVNITKRNATYFAMNGEQIEEPLQR